MGGPGGPPGGPNPDDKKEGDNWWNSFQIMESKNKMSCMKVSMKLNVSNDERHWSLCKLHYMNKSMNKDWHLPLFSDLNN